VGCTKFEHRLLHILYIVPTKQLSSRGQIRFILFLSTENLFNPK